MCRWRKDPQSLWSPFIQSPHNVLYTLSHPKRCLPGPEDKPARNLQPPTSALPSHQVSTGLNRVSKDYAFTFSTGGEAKLQRNLNLPLPISPSPLPSSPRLNKPPVLCTAYWKAIAGAIKAITQDSFQHLEAHLRNSFILSFYCINNRA